MIQDDAWWQLQVSNQSPISTHNIMKTKNLCLPLCQLGRGIIVKCGIPLKLPLQLVSHKLISWSKIDTNEWNPWTHIFNYSSKLREMMMLQKETFGNTPQPNRSMRNKDTNSVPESLLSLRFRLLILKESGRESQGPVFYLAVQNLNISWSWTNRVLLIPFVVWNWKKYKTNHWATRYLPSLIWLEFWP